MTIIDFYVPNSLRADLASVLWEGILGKRARVDWKNIEVSSLILLADTCNKNNIASTSYRKGRGRGGGGEGNNEGCLLCCTCHVGEDCLEKRLLRERER